MRPAKSRRVMGTFMPVYQAFYTAVLPFVGQRRKLKLQRRLEAMAERARACALDPTAGDYRRRPCVALASWSEVLLPEITEHLVNGAMREFVTMAPALVQDTCIVSTWDHTAANATLANLPFAMQGTMLSFQAYCPQWPVVESRVILIVTPCRVPFSGRWKHNFQTYTLTPAAFSALKAACLSWDNTFAAFMADEAHCREVCRWLRI